MRRPRRAAQQQLKFLQMDHSVPKHAICTQWKRAVARWWVEHGGEAHEFTFRTAVDIDFVNYLLFSIEPDARWGAPMVRPRCYLSAHHCNCHKAELEHCRMIGLSDFAQLDLDGHRKWRARRRGGRVRVQWRWHNFVFRSSTTGRAGIRQA